MMFQQPDTLIPDLYQPNDWNRYLYARANPVRYNDPSGHCIDEGDAPHGATNNNICPKRRQSTRSNNPLLDPEYSTWRKLQQGSKCTACHVTHDGYMDDGRISDNSHLDYELVEYYRSKDPLSDAFHSLIFQQGILLGTASTSFNTKLPNIDDITIAPSKLDYLLGNAGKAPGFTDMGYSIGTLDDLLYSVGNEVIPSDFVKVTEYGSKYNLAVEIVGPSGVLGRLNTGWQVDVGSNILRFVTGWVEIFK
jgi:hypothetical protein